jgi:hypothetical protein
LNALRGYEQSRRDDLESIGYVLVYFLKGRLPWQGLRIGTDDNKYRIIYEKKRDTSIAELCEDLPYEINVYIKYVRELTFEEEPDYVYLRSLFANIMHKFKLEYDFQFDWVKQKLIEKSSDKEYILLI